MMQQFPINWWVLLAAVVVRMVLGGLWYSPLLFLNRWMALTGRTHADMNSRMPMLLAVDFVSSLVMAFVLAHAVHYAGAVTWAQGAAVGFFNWLGFVATVTLGITLYERKPFALFVIANGWQLISLLAMGAILAAWP
jgi:hypothetical protein